jgi:ribosomal protein S18 acetylase RimI-like enzyme
MSTAVASRLQPHLRWMIAADLKGVTDLESYLIDGWTEEDFKRVARSKKQVAIVAEYNKRVIGVIVYEGMDTRIDLLHIAVHPEFQGRGIGTALLTRVANKLTPRKAGVRADVWERNLGACQFLKKHRFKAMSILRGFREEDDGIRFWLKNAKYKRGA